MKCSDRRKVKHIEMHKEKVGKLVRAYVKKRVCSYKCTIKEYKWKRGR